MFCLPTKRTRTHLPFRLFHCQWIFSPWKKVFRDKVKHNCLSQLFFSFIIWSRDRKFGGKWDLNFCGITQFHPNLNAGTNTVPTLCFNSSDMIWWINKHLITLIFSTNKFCLKILSTLIFHKMIHAQSNVHIFTYIRLWFSHIPCVQSISHWIEKQLYVNFVLRICFLRACACSIIGIRKPKPFLHVMQKQLPHSTGKWKEALYLW